MSQDYQHAIITGGSSGIGQAIACQLAQKGVHVTIIARNLEKLQLAKAAIEDVTSLPTQQVLALSADVSEATQATQAIESAINQLGPPDLLIPCAGIAHPGHFQSISTEIFERTMAVNYFGTLYCIRAALPAMVAQGKGTICLISSGAGLIGLYGYSAYGPSKFAVRGLAETLRTELKPMKIQVAIAYPPDTDTPQFIEENRTKPAATKEITGMAKLWQADDVAKIVLHGLKKGKFEIAPGTEISVLTRLHSLMSPVLNRHFDRIVSRHQPC